LVILGIYEADIIGSDDMLGRDISRRQTANRWCFIALIL